LSPCSLAAGTCAKIRLFTSYLGYSFSAELVLEHLPILHDEFHLSEFFDIPQRIARNGNQVSQCSGSDYADLPGPVGAVIRGDIALPQEVVSVRLPENPAGYARDLYAALRELEDRGCTSICIESVPASPEWDAIRDRLTRAAA